MKICFDMDGTIADLYGVENWLEYLIAENVKPYEAAKPLVNMSALARRLNTLQRKGYEIGVISWTSKNGSAEYNAKWRPLSARGCGSILQASSLTLSQLCRMVTTRRRLRIVKKMCFSMTKTKTAKTGAALRMM